MTNASVQPLRLDTWAMGLGTAMSAVLVGAAVQVNNGNLHPRALGFITAALFLSCAALLRPHWSAVERRGEAALMAVLGLGLAYQFCELLVSLPGMYLRGGPGFQWYVMGIGLAALLSGAGLSRQPWLGALRMPCLLVVHFALGVWLLKTSPNPFIDVHIFQRDGIAELLSGRNPYAMTFPDIYGANSALFYGPGLSVNGRLLFGYPYPPLTLLMALPGQVLGGDYRYAQLAALTGTGALMAYARPGRVASSAAALFLFTPRIFFVLEQGWTEPLLLLLLAGVVFALCRGWCRVVPYLLGLYFSSKQYLVFASPALLLLYERPFPWRRILDDVARLVVVALGVMIPFFLWSPPAFVHSVVTLQVIQPFRREALCFLSFFFGSAGELPTPWLKALAPAAALGVAALGLWRTPRTPAGFTLATAVSMLVFFACAKQAFCNYYFFGLGVLCLALAALQPAASQVARD